MNEVEAQLKDYGIDVVGDHFILEYWVAGKKSHFESDNLMGLLMQVKKGHVHAAEAVARLKRQKEAANIKP